MCDKRNSVLFTNIGCFVLSPDFKLADESQVLLKVPRKNNMYSVDMKNIIPKESLTCLVAKATLDESMLWHRRLGHVNFKTINKLVKENLVSCLPTKCFENNQTCVACLKGKQHKASSSKDETSGILNSFIIEIENLVDKKVKVIRCDNGTEFKNRVINEGFFVGYSLNSKAFRVYNIRTRKVEENLHIRFLEDKPIIVGDGQKWLFYIDVLTKSMNYVPVVADEGFFVGYLINSKAFRVYNIKTRKVEEKLHIRFLEDEPIIANDGPNWLFDIDVLTKSMNYVPFVACTNSNEFVDGLLFDSSLKNASNDKPQPSSDAKKKDDEGVNKESEIDDQETLENSTQDVNTAGPSINNASKNVNTGSLNINTVSPTVTTAPLEATHVDFFGDETKVDMSNITTTYLVPSTPNTRIHKDHSLDHVIGDVQSGVKTTKTINEQGFISAVYEGKTHEDLHTCLFACFLSQEEPKKVWTMVDLPHGKRAIGNKWVYRNKKDERGIVIRNKARLVAQGYTQEEEIDYDEIFAPVARIEAIRLFLAYASFKDFVVYQMNVKSAFLYGKIEEEVFVCQPLGFEDPEFPDRVYKVEKALYGLHQALRAWYETLSTYLLDNGF
ncbi:ribonuclease H-like domain-containing protein [Tanacetum coccineum]